jgi:hypothetical protein
MLMVVSGAGCFGEAAAAAPAETEKPLWHYEFPKRVRALCLVLPHPFTVGAPPSSTVKGARFTGDAYVCTRLLLRSCSRSWLVMLR